MDPADSKPAAASPVGLPATLAGFHDVADFRIIVNEETLGQAHSEWRADGSFNAWSRISLADQSIEHTLRVTPDDRGCWREIVAVGPNGVRTSVREGTQVRRTARVGDREQNSAFEMPAGALLFDASAPALMAQAVGLYDSERGGVQAFPLLVGGRPPVTLQLEAGATTLHLVNGRDTPLSCYRYAIPGADFLVWADAGGRVMAGHWPRRIWR